MRTVNQALSAARRQVNNPTRSWQGYCLGFVRLCYDAPLTGTGNAITAWERSTQRETRGTPPRGSLVYWDGPTYHGHVAISDGGGWVYSNDILRLGRIDRVRISTIRERWGCDYLGWTRGYIMHPIPELQPRSNGNGAAEWDERASKADVRDAVRAVVAQELQQYANGSLRLPNGKRRTRDELAIDTRSNAWALKPIREDVNKAVDLLEEATNG